jgi:hypothetical protein
MGKQVRGSRRQGRTGAADVIDGEAGPARCWWSIYHMFTTNISCIFISHVCLSMLNCFILMSSTSFDEFVREGAHRRK